MRIELSSSITSSDINLRQIANASNLDVVRSFEAVSLGQTGLPLRTKPHSQVRGLKGALWNQPSAMSRNGTVRDDNLFQVSYHAIWGRRSMGGTSAGWYLKRREQVFRTPKCKNLVQS